MIRENQLQEESIGGCCGSPAIYGDRSALQQLGFPVLTLRQVKNLENYGLSLLELASK